MKKSIGFIAFALLMLVFTSMKSSENREGGEGIKFKHISLEEAKKLAEESGKLIFIDAYTSWCGPCKKMAATTFKNEEVGNIFNEKFINLKIDCEKDADGPELSRMYKVRAYPTLLIIDAKGKLIKQTVGFQTEDRLISFANSVN